MSTRNIIQTTYDEFGKESGCSKKAGSWYRRSAETIVVLNLQKSQYGLQYYVNVGLWLLGLDQVETPKERHCPIRTRLTRLVPLAIEARLTTLLDLQSPIDDALRREELLALLHEHLLPLMEASAALDGLRSGQGQWLIKASLIEGDALRLLGLGGQRHTLVQLPNQDHRGGAPGGAER